MGGSMGVRSKMWDRFSQIENQLPDSVAELVENELAEIDEGLETAAQREAKLERTLEQLERLTRLRP
jgi:hypothetical protein